MIKFYNKSLMAVLVFVSSHLLIAEANGQNKINNREIKASTVGLSVDPKKQIKTIEPNIPKNVSKWIDDELAKATKKPIADFNAPNFFNKANGRVIGYIKGYDVSLGFTTGMVYINNEITNEDTPVVIQIHPDGRFEATLPLTMPKSSHLLIDENWIPFYIEPEQTLSMVLDLNAIKKVDYKGSLAQVNKDLSGYVSQEIDYNTFIEKNKSLSPEEYKRETVTLFKESLESVAQYTKNKLISPKAAEILKNDILIERANLLFDFVDTPTNPNGKEPETNHYYDFLKELPLNQQSILVSKNFPFFVNKLEFCKPLNSNMRQMTFNWKSEKLFFKYIKEEGIDFPQEDKKLYPFLSENEAKMTEAFFKEHKDKIKAFHKKYKYIDSCYFKKYPQYRVEKASQYKDVLIANWKTKDSVLTNIFGLEKNLVYDMIKVRSLKFNFSVLDMIVRNNKNDYKKASNESALDYWNSLKNDIKNPFLITEGNAVFDKVFADKSGTYPLPPGKATDIFNKIISPFKGKIVIVDFWATTCAPCIAMIQSMKDTRKKYEKNKDFEFVFITEDAASPMEHYRKFTKEQELRNSFVVLTDDFQYLRKLFQFNGIPKYVLIDKNGEVLNDDFQMESFASFLNDVLKASN